MPNTGGTLSSPYDVGPSPPPRATYRAFGEVGGQADDDVATPLKQLCLPTGGKEDAATPAGALWGAPQQVGSLGFAAAVAAAKVFDSRRSSSLSWRQTPDGDAASALIQVDLGSVTAVVLTAPPSDIASSPAGGARPCLAPSAAPVKVAIAYDLHLHIGGIAVDQVLSCSLHVVPQDTDLGSDPTHDEARLSLEIAADGRASAVMSDASQESKGSFGTATPASSSAAMTRQSKARKAATPTAPGGSAHSRAVHEGIFANAMASHCADPRVRTDELRGGALVTFSEVTMLTPTTVKRCPCAAYALFALVQLADGTELRILSSAFEVRSARAKEIYGRQAKSFDTCNAKTHVAHLPPPINMFRGGQLDTELCQLGIRTVAHLRLAIAELSTADELDECKLASPQLQARVRNAFGNLSLADIGNLLQHISGYGRPATAADPHMQALLKKADYSVVPECGRVEALVARVTTARVPRQLATLSQSPTGVSPGLRGMLSLLLPPTGGAVAAAAIAAAAPGAATGASPANDATNAGSAFAEPAAAVVAP